MPGNSPAPKTPEQIKREELAQQRKDRKQADVSILLRNAWKLSIKRLLAVYRTHQTDSHLSLFPDTQDKMLAHQAFRNDTGQLSRADLGARFEQLKAHTGMDDIDHTALVLRSTMRHTIGKKPNQVLAALDEFQTFLNTILLQKLFRDALINSLNHRGIQDTPFDFLEFQTNLNMAEARGIKLPEDEIKKIIKDQIEQSASKWRTQELQAAMVRAEQLGVVFSVEDKEDNIRLSLEGCTKLGQIETMLSEIEQAGTLLAALMVAKRNNDGSIARDSKNRYSRVPGQLNKLDKERLMRETLLSFAGQLFAKHDLSIDSTLREEPRTEFTEAAKKASVYLKGLGANDQYLAGLTSYYNDRYYRHHLRTRQQFAAKRERPQPTDIEKMGRP